MSRGTKQIIWILVYYNKINFNPLEGTVYRRKFYKLQ